MTSFKTASTPHLFAHRGGNAAGKEKENSMAAFDSAVKLGFKFLETDVILTKDGQVIAYHGSQNLIMKAHSGLETRKKVQKLSYNDINQKIAKNKEEVPKFISILKKFSEQYISIDVKTDEVVEPLVKIIKQEKAQNRVIITSFSKRRSARANRLLYGEDFKQACLCVYRTKGYAIRYFPKYALNRLKKQGFSYLHIPQFCVNQRLINQANKLGIYIYAWTANEKTDIERLLKLKTHGIISDETSRLLKISRKFKY